MRIATFYIVDNYKNVELKHYNIHTTIIIYYYLNNLKVPM